MFIEDEELRTLYRDTSKEHLDELEAGFLHLEKQPTDLKKIKQLLRNTHSLKGDSRMLGVDDVETISHQIEDILSSVEKGERRFTSALCDCLCQGIDGLRQITRAAVTGEAAHVSTFHILAQLMGGEEAATSPPINADEEFPIDFSEDSLAPFIDGPDSPNPETLVPPIYGEKSPAPIDFDAIEELDLAELDAELGQSLADTVPPPAATTVADHQQPPTEVIDTVRVATAKLDTLVTQAGELVITKGRFSQRLNDIHQILLLWESWSRQTMVQSLAGAAGSELNANASKRLQQTTKDRLGQLGDLLQQLYTKTADDYSQLELISDTLESDILHLRRLPLSNVFSLFPRMVRDLAKEQNKAIELVIEGEHIQVDKRILEEIKDPLLHLMRNAIDHGIESPSERAARGKSPIATIYLKAHQQGNKIAIDVMDDGRGLNPQKIKQTAVSQGLHTEKELNAMGHDQVKNLIFAPGFSTRQLVTELSGRGVGLDVVRVGIERLKGTIQVQSSPGQGCTFSLRLSTSLATTPALIVSVAGHSYAIPLDYIERMVQINPLEIFTHRGVPTITVEATALSVARLADLLNLPADQPATTATKPSSYCVVMQVESQRFGLLVDELSDQQDIVLKPHSRLIEQIPYIAGSTILNTGKVAVVLEPKGFAPSLQSTAGNVLAINSQETAPPPRVLLVEDSITIRTQIRRILEKVGYHVTTAVDGLDGLEQLQAGAVFDAVISDVEMPNLDGLSLTRRIRQDLSNTEIPIILITTLAGEDDKRRGVEAGANAYITKGNFEQRLLTDTLRNLIA
ncbi:hybrid sensor histidine kinase/response regulator [Leptothoe kymatousa]|uniref:histidine kinase n=1 Tax=Leptothoe kymatousa TAU-MAC 1615 TaxID=2364775 RepID=A0ABS5Y7M3_9CYAN|nr:response regulator [Leptothoe kymatousa]MBT9313606.1 response regulator [Leptothoe kymatousa TAU-MAC 1615]